MITITKNAAKQIQSQADENSSEKMTLRIAVRKDGQGAFEYGIGFDETSDTDLEVTSGGVKLVLSPDMKELLEGTTIDYVELEPGKHHFIFMNPNDPNYTAPKD